MTADAHHSGQFCLKLASDGTPASPATVVQQNTQPIQTNSTYTLSLWYVPTTNSLELTLRLSDNSIAVITNVLYQPLP